MRASCAAMRQSHASASSKPPPFGDGHAGQVLEPREHALHVLHDRDHAVASLRRGDARADQRQVGTGAERLQRAAQMQHRQRRVGLGQVEHGVEFGEQPVVDGVDRRARERDHQRGADALGGDHGRVHVHPSNCSASLRRSSLPVAVRGSAATGCSQAGRW
jgi:hypothetical protein